LIFAFALHTGLRPEEYLGLKRSYLDLDHRDKQGRLRGLARVRQTVVINANGQGWYWSEPKTKKGVRDVFFPHWLAQEMKSHLAKQGAQKLALGRHYQDNDLVFATSLGTPHRRINVSRRHFKPILVEAKLSDRKLYSLRHSYATLSLLAGVDPKVVSEQMGHASVAFTLNVYHHVLEGLREEGSDKLERLLELAEKTEEAHSESNEG
jgi:integrase